MTRKFYTLGTSHSRDTNNTSFDNLYYNHNLDSSWPLYLAKKLETSGKNFSIPAIGIDTYMPRVCSIINQLKNNVLLIEIPSILRLNHPLNGEIYSRCQQFDPEFWNPCNTNISYSNIIYRYTPADIDEDPTSFIKFKQINRYRQTKLPVDRLQDSFKILIDYNETYLEDIVVSNCLALDGYLKHNNVIPVWFSFNFPIAQYINNINMLEFRKLTLLNSAIDNYTILDYFLQKQNKRKSKNYRSNKEWFADGYHLNSNHWRVIVDEIFVDFLRRYITAN